MDSAESWQVCRPDLKAHRLLLVRYSGTRPYGQSLRHGFATRPVFWRSITGFLGFVDVLGRKAARVVSICGTLSPVSGRLLHHALPSAISASHHAGDAVD